MMLRESHFGQNVGFACTVEPMPTRSLPRTDPPPAILTLGEHSARDEIHRRTTRQLPPGPASANEQIDT